MMRLLVILFFALFLASCEYEEVERETGYKGKARANPWLAAERYVLRSGLEARPVIAWTAPEPEDFVWIMPASILGNESYIRRTENWVYNGGHLILLVEHADSETNDWWGHAMSPDLKPVLISMLDRMGIRLLEKSKSGGKTTAGHVNFKRQKFKVEMNSSVTVAVKNHKAKPGTFASRKFGDGRMTVLTDGRVFRNRWIGDHQHADLLQALIDSSGYEGRVGFMRGSGLSLWGLLKEHLPQILIGFAVWILLWLWKNLSRFGPIEAAAPPPVLRGYEHHLEALGDFQWRLDHASSLLAPLREMVIEIGQRTSVRSGHRDDDFFQFLADRAGLTRERVFRALAEEKPADSTILTRTTADLQQLLKVLTSNTRP